MWRSIIVLLLAPVLLASSLPARDAAAADFLVFPVKASLPLQMVVLGMEVDQVAKIKLKENDVVNLALGRALGTKVDKKTEILAIAVDFAAPAAKLIVFDPTQTGPAQVTTTVATDDARLRLGSDVARGAGAGHDDRCRSRRRRSAIPPTTRCTRRPALATGAGKSSAFVPPGLDLKLSVKGIVAGRMSFTTTAGGQTTTFAGFVVNGKAKASGKAIGSFSE